MQINGVNEFFSRIASLNGSGGVRGNSFLLGLAPQGQAAHDSLFLSDIGKRLSFNTEKAPLLGGNEKASSIDPVLNLAKKSMTRVKDIMEQMHALAVAAQDESLTDLDRVNMQIQFEDLRKELTAIPRSMLSQYYGGPVVMPEPDYSLWGEFGGDSSNILERMRHRIENGQPWDVREAWSEGFTNIIYNDEGVPIGEKVVKPGWHVVDDNNKNIQTTRVSGEGPYGTLYEFENSGNELLTVRERLEKMTPVILMDAKSAADGAELLAQKLNEAHNWLAKIDELSAVQQATDTGGLALVGEGSFSMFSAVHNFLKKHPLMGEIGPDIPQAFLHSDGLYDRPSSHLLRGVVYGERDSIPLGAETNEEKRKNDVTANGPLYIGGLNMLNNAALAGIKTNQNYTVQYVEAINFRASNNYGGFRLTA
jgi:hypothetical protein